MSAPSPSQVVARIELMVESVMLSLGSAALPSLSSASLPPADSSSSSSSVGPALPAYRKRMTLDGSKSYANALLVMSFVHELLNSGRTTTIREVYYHYCTHFSSQDECNRAITDVSRLLSVDRSALGLFASPKGWIAGSLTINSSTSSTSSSSSSSASSSSASPSSSSSAAAAAAVRYGAGESAVPITSEWLSPDAFPLLRGDDDGDCSPGMDDDAPPDNEGMDVDAASPPPRPVFTSDAQFILVVEKEGVFSRIVEDRFFDRVPSIVVTGKGFPDLATRACVRQLSEQLGIPVLGLCDCNPYGLGVLMSYRGTRAGGVGGVDSERYESDVRWLGLRPSQVNSLAEEGGTGALPPSVFQELSDKDRGKIASIARSPFVKEEQGWGDELDKMARDGWKMELEALSWLGVDYMTPWLEARVLGGDWL
ncbi:hypothetical protein TeGR_g6240 [Tetraparma gracilis]|uniref:DNA topoisomerase (ATP-hydrolyzing) n=1 Tax=Tetraparma gracilis TaxID=2962635 RepID=A0ABQ6M7C0_9STRA|nr:hypothetical protein TeGR_g6240 [Tetraparma gracilis]